MPIAVTRFDTTSRNSGFKNDEQTVRLRAVARAFKIIGWCGIVLYTPIIIGCAVSFLITLFGHRIESPLILAGATAFNGAILALAVCYVITGRRISKRQLDAKRHAILLSCVMMFGFPILTVVGILCYRYIRLYFDEESIRG